MTGCLTGRPATRTVRLSPLLHVVTAAKLQKGCRHAGSKLSLGYNAGPTPIHPNTHP